MDNNRGYDLISHNTFYHSKNTFQGIFSLVVEQLSAKISQNVRDYQDDHIRAGKGKMIMNLNCQLNDKIKLIARVMSRIIYGFGDPNEKNGGSWSNMEKKGNGQSNQSGSAISILSFMTVCKDVNKKSEPNT